MLVDNCALSLELVSVPGGMIPGMESNETKRSVCCPICNEQIDLPAIVTMQRPER